MTRLEWRWCLKYSVLLAALTGLPYLVAIFERGEAWAFTGSVIAVEDGNSYIAKMRLGASGDWLFRTPYSSSPQRGLLAFLPYLLLGKLAGTRPSHSALLILYHALRLAAIPLAVAATYRFHALWVASDGWRRWGTLLATLVATTGIPLDHPTTPSGSPQASAAHDQRPALVKTIDSFRDWLSQWRKWARTETNRRAHSSPTTTPTPALSPTTRRPL